MCHAIWTTPAIIWKSIFSNCDDRSDQMFSAIVTIVNDHMETRLKNYKNRGFLQFPDTGILTTIAILMTARFTPIGRNADCSWYLLVMMFLWLKSFSICHFFCKFNGWNLFWFLRVVCHYDKCQVNKLHIDYPFHVIKFQTQLSFSFFSLSFWLHYSKLYIYNSMKIKRW